MKGEREASVHRWASDWLSRMSVTELRPAELPDFLRCFRPVTVLISQRHRGGLGAWPSSALRPDLCVAVASGDEAAEAVSLCISSKAKHQWPLVCVVMGAFHASQRVQAAARMGYAQGVYVIVVAGR